MGREGDWRLCIADWARHLDNHAFTSIRMRIVRPTPLVSSGCVTDPVSNGAGRATCSGGLGRIRLLKRLQTIRMSQRPVSSGTKGHAVNSG